MVEPIRLDYAANDAEVIAAFKRQQAELEKERKAREALQKQINETSKTQKDADRQMAEGQKEAQRVIEKSATAQQKYAAEVAKIEALHKKGHLTVEQYNQALAHQKSTLDGSSKSSDVFGGSLAGLAGKIGASVTAFAAMRAVISFLKTEYDALLERQGKSADATISLAVEQEALLMNIGSENSEAIVDKIAQLSAKSGVKQENVTRAVNEAMAARGDFAVQDVIDAVGSAAKVRKFAPAELAGLASATVDVRKQTGLGTDESLGFLLQLQAQSRTKSLKELAANFTPAVGGIMQMGADRQTAGAMLASLSHGMGDTSGAQTKTAALQLTSQLRDFGGGAPIADVISQLQRDPRLRQNFLSNMTSEVAARPAIESLLSGGNVARQFGSSVNALRQNPLTALADAEKARNLGAMKIAEVDTGMASTVDSVLLSDREGAMAAVVRKRLLELSQAMPGMNSHSSKIKSGIDDLLSGGTPGLATLEERVAEIAKQPRNAAYVLHRGKLYNEGIQSTAETTAQFDAEFLKTDAGKNMQLLQMLVDEIKQMRADNERANQMRIVGNRANNQKEGGL